MYHPTTRVLTVLELLQSHHRLTGPELADRLEVDVRTVRRYILMLQDLGIPIEAERGRHGAYVLRPGFKLPPLMFTEDEALALTLGLQAARRLNLATAAPAVEGALAKIERVLPAAMRDRVKAVQQSLVIDMRPADDETTAAVVVTLGNAAQQSRRVRLCYRSNRGEATERLLDPYGLVYHAGRWYAVGYCHLRHGLRVFRLDRVLLVEPLDQLFVRPDGFDSLGYVLHSFATMPGSWQVEVLLRAGIDTVSRLVPRTLGTLEQTPDGVVLRCFVESLEWMAGFLAGLGIEVRVQAPDELRTALRQLATRLCEAAS